MFRKSKIDADIVMINIDGLIVLKRPMKNDTVELVLPITLEVSIRYSISVKFR